MNKVLLEKYITMIVKKTLKEESERFPARGWYEYLQGSDKLENYPKEFVDWLDSKDTWAYTYVQKYKITKLSDLYKMWSSETY